MKKDEFLEQLVYLLQDIPDGDREEAIQYYRDYLEEAGSENEEQTIGEFGSPERVAAIIRADLAGNLSEGGSFTDKGYEDERFRDPNYEIAKRLDLPEASGQSGEGSSPKNTQDAADQSGAFQDSTYRNATYGDRSYRDGRYRNTVYRNSSYQDDGYRNAAYGDSGYQDGGYGNTAFGGSACRDGGYRDTAYEGSSYQNTSYHDGGFESQYEDSRASEPVYAERKKKPWTNKVLKWILWIVLFCAASPVILGVGGTVSGLIVGVFSLILGVFAVVAVMTVGMIVVGVITGSMGLTLIGINFFDFLLLMGLSMMSFGLGILGMILSWLLLGGFVPFLWKSIVKLVRSLAGRRRGGRGNE